MKHAIQKCIKASFVSRYAKHIITHVAPTTIQMQIATKYKPDKLTNFLEEIKNGVLYKRWYFGHYHKDTAVDTKHICNYYGITHIN